jgi:hypothetical protein
MPSLLADRDALVVATCVVIALLVVASVNLRDPCDGQIMRGKKITPAAWYRDAQLLEAKRSRPHANRSSPRRIPAAGAAPTGLLGWSIEDEAEKRGAGLLLFGYGGLQLSRFLGEATTAAAMFRRDNPRLRIAVVSNNATVDARYFNIHIRPRADLLFAGDNQQSRPDKLPRQWLTRLYYLAQSPFELTWALDSNVVSCTEGAAQAFLDEARRNKLWGYDIAHASQTFTVMYPHNWNIIYRWSARTSSLMRDWLLLQLRRGVTHDDQKTLHISELRHQKAGLLSVGQIKSNFAAAFYPVGNRGQRKHNARITRKIVGRAHVVHSTEVTACASFNDGQPAGSPWAGSHAPAPRQMLTLATPQSSYGERHVAHSDAECAALLAPGWVGPRTDRQCPGRQVEPQEWIYTPNFELLRNFVKSGRGGEDYP